MIKSNFRIEREDRRGTPQRKKAFFSLFLFLSIYLLFLISFSSALPNSTLTTSYEIKSTIINHETDYNADGIPDVRTTYKQLNDTLIEIKVYQTNPNTKGGNAYKWQSAVFNIEGLDSLKYQEYNPATQVWSPAIALNLYNYQYTTKWNVSGNYYGYSLFGSGSGNKTYRLILPSNHPKFKIFTGSNSEEVYYEWINSTYYLYTTDTYDRDPFQVEVYDCSGNKLTYPDMAWAEPIDNTDGKIIFYPKLNDTTPRTCIRFKVNKFQQEYTCTESFFYKSCPPHYELNFEDFEAKNNITSRNITEVHGSFWISFWDNFPFFWRAFKYNPDVNYYWLEYQGNIVDLDPALILTYSSTGDLLYTNKTEGTNQGARLTASVLSMDFNTPGEASSISYYNQSAPTYIKDSSVYNNYGTINEPNYWFTDGVINGSLHFDGVNDYVSMGTQTINYSANNFTFSGWIYRETAKDWAGIYRIGTEHYLQTNNGNKLYLVNTELNTSGLTGTNTINIKTWYHYVVVWDGTNLSIYLNGTLDKTINNSIGSGKDGSISGEMAFSSSTSTNTWFGKMDEFMWFNRSLSQDEITNLYNNQSAGLRESGLENDTSLKMYLKLDETSGTKAYDRDYSPFSTSRWWTTGNFSNALAFDGVDDYVNTTTMNMTNVTISAWIKQASLGTNYYDRTIVGNSRAGPASGFVLRTGGQKIDFIIRGSSDVSNTTGNLIGSTNTWYHIIGTYDTSNGLSIYLNGALVGRTISTTTPVASNIALGIGNDPYYGRYFNGTIDEVMIFNRSLSASEVNNLYLNQSANIDDVLVSDSSLVSYWRLNETNGTTARDEKGVNNGTLLNYLANTTYPGFNDGTLTNFNTVGTNPIWNATGGYDGSGAYQFDGVDDKITTQNVPSSNIGLTYALWVKPNGVQKLYAGYLGQRTGLFSGLSQGGGATNDIEFYIANTNLGGASLSINSWSYVIATYDPTLGYRLYINGTKVKEVNTTGYAISGGVYTIGNDIGVAGRVFNGSIDQVQIFPRALSANEVLDLYNGSMNKLNKYPEYAGDFKSGVFYNSTSSYWNITLSTADTTSRSGLVNNDNSINLSNPNLVSYWSLDNNFLDSKGRNNGTCTSTTCPNNASGLSSNAMRFDGSDDYVNLSTPLFANDTAGSFSAWVNPTTITAYNNIFANGGDSATMVLWLRISNAGKLQVLDTSSRSISSVNSLISNQWSYITITTNGTFYRLYINGNEENTTIVGSNTGNWFGDVATTNEKYLIGVAYYGGGTYANYFNGTLDEVIIYNSTLTQAQISQLYKSGLSQHANTNITIQTRTANNYNISDSGLVSFWSFNKDNATTAIDELGRNNLIRNGGILNSSDGNGTVGKGYYFDGSDDFFNYSTGLINVSAPFAVSMWVSQADTTDGRVYLNEREIAGSYNGIMIELLSRKFTFLTGAGNIQSTTLLDANKWYHLTYVYNGSRASMYINGINENNVNVVLVENSSIRFSLGQNPSVLSNHKGSMDEVRIYNRSLSASEVQNLYELGSYHISDWSNWSNETLIQDGVSYYTTTSGKFSQFKTNFYTNTTDSTPYVQSYNITTTIAQIPDVAPTITFNYKQPADINLAYLASENAVNITYNITDVDTTGINLSTVYMCHKTNSTTEDITQFLNGTESSGYRCSTEHYISNDSITFLFQVKGNGVIPATYNLDEEVFEDTPHVIRTLSGTNSYFSTTYLNVSNDTQFNLLEQMVNSTTNAGVMRFYACNDSFGFSNSPASNANCYEFNSLTQRQTFHHSHSNYSKHQVISLVINGTTGTIGTVKVTSTMHFINRGSNVGDWYVYQINQSARALTTRVSTNNGATWTTPANTTDGHLHQFHVNETFYWYVCANDTANLESCSAVLSDRLEEAGLPPTAPSVYSPENTSYVYTAPININWTASLSPNSYPIANYTITLYNYDFTLNKTITNVSGSVLSYIWDASTTTLGQYRIGVQACDNQSQCTSGYSMSFTLRDKYIYNATIFINGNDSGGTQYIYYPSTINATLYNYDSVCIANLTRNTVIVDNENGVVVRFSPGLYVYNVNAPETDYCYELAQVYRAVNVSINDTAGLAVTASPDWTVNEGTETTVTGINCPTELTCELFRDDSLVANPDVGTFFAGTYVYRYNTTGNENYTAFTVNTYHLVVQHADGNVTVVPTRICRWSKLGYYNLKLPWIRQDNCLCEDGVIYGKNSGGQCYK